jgi:hypothetical protein
MGRFMSPDPSQLYYADPTNPQSLNLYSYALNNPLRFLDPSGLTVCDYGTNDDGSEDYESADTPEECTSSDGTVVVDQQSVTVTADSDGNLTETNYSAQMVDDPGWIQLDIGSNTQPSSRKTQAGSPNNGPNYSRADICAASALLHSGLNTALDAFGMIPGEGTLLKSTQLAGGVISAGMAAPGNSPTTASLAGAGVGLGAADASGTAQITANVFGKSLKVIPFVGNLLSAYAAKRDLNEMGAYYNDCMAGKN